MCALKLTLFLFAFRTCYAIEQDVIPKSYELKLTPFLENSFNFTGQVDIDVLCTFSTKEIILHSSGLTIKNVQVTRIDKNKHFPCTYEQQTNDLLYISTQDYLAYGITYRINVQYEGQLDDDMNGFFKTSYKMGHQTRWIAVTQFQPNFARMAFPCFDEPKFRTPFTVSVARYKHQTALSNMPRRETTEEDPTINNRVWDTFETTPPISTYLLAVVVSDYATVQSEDYRITIWARANAIADATYIVRQSKKILEQLEAYTGMQYQLPKLDFVAIPYFKVAGMENWGLITYRENFLLYNNHTCSTKAMETVIATVAHELAHQWFGDYVTPQKWDYLWLSEGFATYYKYYITAAIEPKWRMDQFFVPDALHYALWIDEVDYHHAMTKQLRSTTEVEQIFDAISYYKSASVIRMFEHLVSSQTFRKTIKRYLQDGYNNGSSVQPDTLWGAFDKQAIHDNVQLPLAPSEIMKEWTTNRGYPLIIVTTTNNRSIVIVEQKTYKSPRSQSITTDQRWIVPLTYTTKYSLNFLNTTPTHWSGLNSTNSSQLQIPLRDDEWIIFNKQQTGYYRVNYDLENWNLLVTQLHTRHELIHVLNRAQLIDDSFGLAIDEKLPYDVPINLVNYLDNEFDPIPWFSALKYFNYLISNFQHTAIGNIVKEYILERVENQYKKLGFHNRISDDHLTKTSRPNILALACFLGHSDCISKVKKYYEIHSEDLSKIPGDLKTTVYCTMLNYANSDSVWNKLWTIYQTTNIAYEREAILSVIGCINHHELIVQIIEKLFNINNDDIYKRDRSTALRSIYSTSNGVIATLNYIDELLSQQKDPNVNDIIKATKLVNAMKPHVKSENQTRILKKLIGDTNSKNAFELVHALRITYFDALHRIQLNKKRIQELKNAIEISVRPHPTEPSMQQVYDRTSSSAIHLKLSFSVISVLLILLFKP